MKNYYYEMICIHCNEAATYKCPTCRKSYCSVNCCKVHKTSPCTRPTSPSTQMHEVKSNINYDYPTEDTVSLEKLELLQNSKELQKCLENPHVREILEILDISPNPDMLMKDYMQETIFTEFVDACLNVVQDKTKE